MPRAIDVITAALRRLGVVAVDEPVQAADAAYARDVLDGLFAEIAETQGLGIDFDLDTVPRAYVEPLGVLLAVDIAPAYTKAPPTTRSGALVRIRAISWPLVAPEDEQTEGDDPTDYGWSPADVGGNYF